ncbi:vacuolar protein sorting-associated protein 8 homolog isoform X1 [Argopecten irradians]|uniref:vacuolar protein sorting-associated protein 8 homolog isoform X1 n=2 Tax=Argopecten irradians TaxID=31199 RepID=UPI003712C7CB
MAETGEGGETGASSANLLDFDLQLDDAEFDLPSVENPTLESILNEPDDQESVLDEDEVSMPSSLQLFRESGDTSSLSSQDSMLSDRPRKREKKRKGIHYSIHGSVLKPSKLKSISAQLLSAADRVDAGMPTAMAVSALIAVGTSHGLVLIFYPKQVLKWCLGSTAVGSQYGSVSAISFNRDCTRLLSGFAKGQITMWDLTNGKLLRTITDAHPPGTAVLHIKFTDSLVLAVCSDSGGSVFELEFKRLIGVRTCESKCLFSGSRGEVCAIEPLHMNLTIKDHPMQDVMVIAMATMSKVLLVTIRPQLKVFFTHQLKGDPATLPLLAWQFVIIQVSESDRVIDPVLAFARDSTIHFYQVICNNGQDIRCSGLQKITVQYKILGIHWLNTRTLVVMDTTEKMHVIDVRSEEEIEVLDVSEVQMVYNTSFFKSLATGGNVSQALAFAGERACYQTLVSHGGQLFLLGTKTVHVYALRNWRDRIDVLVKQNRYQDALVLALSFYESKAKGVVGLVGSHRKKQEMVSHLMLDLLFEFVDLSMTMLCPEQGKIEELEEHYQGIVPICVDYCLHLNKTDILFGRIFERFSADMIAHGVFLECLEPYILADKLTSIPPTVMKDFVDSYEGKGMLENVEACIVHLEITSLDIHQVVSLCWGHGLYDAILYVYNRGMNDYTTPLEDLLSTLRAAVDTGKQLSDNQIKLGNKLLVYISCCLAGRAYPLGDIAEELVTGVKESVYQCVTCLHTKQFSDDEPAYPHLRTLLQFDTREFLNVLALAFEESEFNTEEGVQKRQRMVDVLLQVMVESVGFTPTQVGILFTFLARQMARHENTIVVNRVLFDQVLEFLSNPSDESRHEERQQALMELLHAGGLLQIDEERLLYLAENAKFYRVCELLYEKQHKYGKILSCYLRDYSRKYHSFNYINSIINSERFTELEKEDVRQEAMAHLQELVAIDCKQAAQVVITALSSNLSAVVKELNTNPAVLFEFLQGVMSYRDSMGSAIHQERQVVVEPHIFELYIDLMAQYRPNDVYSYIKLNEGYRLEQTLEICRKHKLSNATAYLLEKAGDIQGAFGIMLENLQTKLKNVTDVLLGATVQKDAKVLFSEVQLEVVVIVQLCQRNSGNMDEAQRELLWFPLLEAMMSPQRKLKDVEDKELLEEFKEPTQHVLTSMSEYIQLPAILQKIMQDPAYSTGKFGEVKDLILGMLEKYNYEKTLRKTCKNLLNHDIHVHLRSLTSVAAKGFVTKGDNCNLCNKPFTSQSDTDSIIVFRCGHGYHLGCLRSVGSVHLLDGEELWACYLCSHTKRGHVHSSRFHRSLSNTAQSLHHTHKDKPKEMSFDPQHLQAIDYVRRSMRTPSRIAILTELSKPDQSSRASRAGSTIFNEENFRLKLAPPPAMEVS